jgi:hypothetical protein
MKPLNIGFCALLAVVFGAVVAQDARAIAIVGEPYGAGAGGTFGIVIKQANVEILRNDAVVLPSDIKDPGLSHVKLGKIGGSDVYLEVKSDGTSAETFRVVHFFIKSTDPSNYDLAGPTSLFTSGGGPIDVSISGIQFNNPDWVLPQVGDSFYDVSYMTNAGGNFYDLPNSEPYQTGNPYRIQVRGPSYTDSNTADYNFTSSGPSGAPWWKWSGIIPPVGGQGGTQTYSVTGQTDEFTGYVRELGLSVAFSHEMPEPTALCLLAAALPLLRRRSR